MTFACPCFLYPCASPPSILFFSVAVVLKYSASTQRKIDCKSTLNQQWDGKQSLICQQQRVLLKKRQCFLLKMQDFSSTKSN